MYEVLIDNLTVYKDNTSIDILKKGDTINVSEIKDGIAYLPDNKYVIYSNKFYTNTLKKLSTKSTKKKEK